MNRKIILVFVLTVGLLPLLGINSLAKAPVDPGTPGTGCTDGQRKACPNIEGLPDGNGGTNWQAQAEPCRCTGTSWTGNCFYAGNSSWTFYMYSGSCSNNTRKRKWCKFTSQSIRCDSAASNASSISPTYTCSSTLENVTCTCVPNAVEYKYEIVNCSTITYKRTCNTYGSDWGSWVLQ